MRDSVPLGVTVAFGSNPASSDQAVPPYFAASPMTARNVSVSVSLLHLPNLTRTIAGTSFRQAAKRRTGDKGFPESGISGPATMTPADFCP